MMPMTDAKSGIEKMLLSRPAMIVPTPMPASAVPTGKPMASTEPKARMRTMMAKAKPSVSELGGSKSAKTWPPSSTWRPGTSSGMAAFTSFVRSAASSMVKSRGRPTRANATVPSWEICWAPSGLYGDVTLATESIAATSVKNCVMACCTAGSVTPCSAWKTKVPPSPSLPSGKLASMMSRPRALSTSGRSNWVLYPCPMMPVSTMPTTNGGNPRKDDSSAPAIAPATKTSKHRALPGGSADHATPR